MVGADKTRISKRDDILARRIERDYGVKATPQLQKLLSDVGSIVKRRLSAESIRETDEKKELARLRAWYSAKRALLNNMKRAEQDARRACEGNDLLSVRTDRHTGLPVVTMRPPDGSDAPTLVMNLSAPPLGSNTQSSKIAYGFRGRGKKWTGVISGFSEACEKANWNLSLRQMISMWSSKLETMLHKLQREKERDAKFVKEYTTPLKEPTTREASYDESPASSGELSASPLHKTENAVEEEGSESPWHMEEAPNSTLSGQNSVSIDFKVPAAMPENQNLHAGGQFVDSDANTSNNVSPISLEKHRGHEMELHTESAQVEATRHEVTLPEVKMRVENIARNVSNMIPDETFEQPHTDAEELVGDRSPVRYEHSEDISDGVEATRADHDGAFENTEVQEIDEVVTARSPQLTPREDASDDGNVKDDADDDVFIVDENFTASRSVSPEDP